MGQIYSTLLTNKRDQFEQTSMLDAQKITNYTKAISACSNTETKSRKLSNLKCLWTLQGRIDQIAISKHFADLVNLINQVIQITMEAYDLDVAFIEDSSIKT